MRVKAGEQSELEFSDLKSNTEYYIYMVLYDKNEISYSVFAESVMTSAPSMELKKHAYG